MLALLVVVSAQTARSRPRKTRLLRPTFFHTKSLRYQRPTSCSSFTYSKLLSLQRSTARLSWTDWSRNANKCCYGRINRSELIAYRPSDRRNETYAGRVGTCLLINHNRINVRKGRDRQTYRQTDEDRQTRLLLYTAIA